MFSTTPFNRCGVVFSRCAIACLAIYHSSAYAVVNIERLPELSLQELMDVEITSVFKRPEKLAQSPSAIQVITRDQIRRSGATNIPEALRLATNLNVAQQNAHEWVVSARGFSSDVGNKLLVLIDGRTVYTPLFSGVFWDRQDYLLEDIDRIEVISGPGGALWGANAVNGVINIITRSSEKTIGTYAEAGAGTALQGFAGVRHGGALGDRGDYRVYGKFFERDAQYLGDGSTGDDSWHMGQTGFRMDVQASDRDTLTLQGDYFRNEASLLRGDESESSGHNILSRWTRTLGDKSSTQLQFYYDHTELVLPTGEFSINGTVLAPDGVFQDQLKTYDLDFQHQFTWGERQKILWGLGYRKSKNEVDNAPALGFFPESLEQDLYSGFIQNEIALVPNELTFTIGTKLERNDYTGNEWEPTARLHWNLSPNDMVWAAASRAVRMPSRIDREISQGTPPYFVLLAGGPEFKSEKVNAYEIGYRVQSSEQVMGSASFFYNEYQDIRSTSFSPNTIFPLFFENNVEGSTYGAELNLIYQANTWWQVRGGYTFLEHALRVKSGEFDFNNAQNETADPKHQISLRSSMDLSWNLELDIGFRWIDKLPTNDAGDLVYVPSYAELDLRIGWHPSENIELSLVGQNLLRDHHQEFGIPGDGQEEIGRNIYGKIQWRY